MFSKNEKLFSFHAGNSFCSHIKELFLLWFIVSSKKRFQGSGTHRQRWCVRGNAHLAFQSLRKSPQKQTSALESPARSIGCVGYAHSVFSSPPTRTRSPFFDKFEPGIANFTAKPEANEIKSISLSKPEVARSRSLLRSSRKREVDDASTKPSAARPLRLLDSQSGVVSSTTRAPRERIFKSGFLLPETKFFQWHLTFSSRNLKNENIKISISFDICFVRKVKTMSRVRHI